MHLSHINEFIEALELQIPELRAKQKEIINYSDMKERLADLYVMSLELQLEMAYAIREDLRELMEGSNDRIPEDSTTFED